MGFSTSSIRARGGPVGQLNKVGKVNTLDARCVLCDEPMLEGERTAIKSIKYPTYTQPRKVHDPCPKEK